MRKNCLSKKKMFSSYSAKTKRDGRTDRQTGGCCNISRPGPSARQEIIKPEAPGVWAKDLINLIPF